MTFIEFEEKKKRNRNNRGPVAPSSSLCTSSYPRMQRNVSTSLFAQVKVLRDMAIFQNNTSRVLFVCFFIPMSPGSDDFVDQSTEGACSSNLPASFQASQYPQRRSTARRCETSTAHFGSRPLLVVETRTVPHLLRTEPHPPVEIRH